MQTVNLYIGGCSLERHFRNLKGDKREYTLEVNGHFAEGFTTGIREALAAFVRESCPKAKLLLQQTWGYESGSERIRQHGFETYEEMFGQALAQVVFCWLWSGMAISRKRR